ncbi:hypothetical protein BH24ACT4_BH24ACT4_13230 [soil metagenome]
MNVPLIAIAIVGVVALVPESKDRSTPPLDLVGLGLSIAAITAVVLTIIEAPEWGWLSPTTALGAGAGVVLQLIRGYSPLEVGLRTLPVAISIAVASLLSPKLVERVGTKVVVSAGLASMAIGFGWVSTASAGTPYAEIVGQMIFLGAGLGMTTAPATESIMGSVSADKAGVGSAATTPPASSGAPSGWPSSARCSTPSTSAP